MSSSGQSSKASKVQDVDIREKLSLWESSLATLTSSQKDGIMSLSAQANNRPLPSNLPLKNTSTLVTSGSSVRRASRNAERVEGVSDFGEDAWTQLESSCDAKVETFQQLHTWLRKMDAGMEEDEIKSYKAFSDQLKDYDKKCEDLLKEIDTALDLFQDMKKKHSFVSTKTNALHNACQQLMDDETQLRNVAESITSKLAFFEDYDKVEHRLNSPAMSVTNESFVPLLAKLDDCIKFMKEHPQYKESPIYLARFLQLQSRALNMVKSHVVAILRSTTHSLLLSTHPGAGDKSSSGVRGGEGVYSLHYGKFRSSAPKIKSLVKEIELRESQSPGYRLLLEDCHQCYLAQRSQLIVSSAMDNLQRMEKDNPHNLCGLVRASCGYICRVCLDEYKLFFCFFSEKSTKLDVFMESLCYMLYDLLRPPIIKVVHLETLGELCNIFKVEILEDQIGARRDELSSSTSVFEQLLEDVQQRLVYRAQKFIQTDIGGYAHSPGDLAYPDKLIVAREAGLRLVRNDSDSVFETSASENESETSKPHPSPNVTPLAPADHHAMWYPTVRRTLLCLSKLYRCVERSTFEGLAFEALRECVKSLEKASAMITAKKGKIDGHLFLIKHLLIVREQIAPFEVNFTVREMQLDFTKTKAAAYELLKKRSRMFSLGGNNAFLEFFLHAAPELSEHYIDSRKEVDLNLKTVCEQFILHITTLFSSPLRTFLDRVNVLKEIATKEGQNLGEVLQKQPFSEAKAVHDVVSETCSLIKTHAPTLWFSLSLYLASEETEYILFKPIKTSIVQDFDSVRQLATSYYSDEDQLIIACPLPEQVSLMLARQVSRV